MENNKEQELKINETIENKEQEQELKVNEIIENKEQEQDSKVSEAIENEEQESHININGESSSGDSESHFKIQGESSDTPSESASEPNVSHSRKYAWYMVSTLPNKEEKVIESLKNKISFEDIGDQFNDFKIFLEPRITKTELAKRQRGEDHEIKYVNLYKGYIFINMRMTDESWFLTRNTEGVTGLVGSHGSGVKPTPISSRKFKKHLDTEIKRKDEFMKEINSSPFNVSDLVKIIKGPYKSQDENDLYTIKEVSEPHEYVLLEVEAAGKLVTVEMPFTDVKVIKPE